MRSSNV